MAIQRIRRRGVHSQGRRGLYKRSHTFGNDNSWWTGIQISKFHTKASSRIRRRACLGKPRSINSYIWWLVEIKLVDQVLVRKIKKNLKEVWKYSLQMVMEWWFFLVVEVVPTGVRTHVVATTVCVTGSVHALTCCTHICLVYIHCAYTSHILMRVTHMHGSRVPKRFIACVSHLSISPSPFLMFHPSVLFPHGHFETTPDYDFTDDLVHTFLS